MGLWNLLLKLTVFASEDPLYLWAEKGSFLGISEERPRDLISIEDLDWCLRATGPYNHTKEETSRTQAEDKSEDKYQVYTPQVNETLSKLCTITPSRSQVELLKMLVNEGYWYQYFIGKKHPVVSFFGATWDEEQGPLDAWLRSYGQKEKHDLMGKDVPQTTLLLDDKKRSISFIFTHQAFIFHTDRNLEITHVDLHKSLLRPIEENVPLTFTYSIQWIKPDDDVSGQERTRTKKPIIHVQWWHTVIFDKFFNTLSVRKFGIPFMMLSVVIWIFCTTMCGFMLVNGLKKKQMDMVVWCEVVRRDFERPIYGVEAFAFLLSLGIGLGVGLIFVALFLGQPTVLVGTFFGHLAMGILLKFFQTTWGFLRFHPLFLSLPLLTAPIGLVAVGMSFFVLGALWMPPMSGKKKSCCTVDEAKRALLRPLRA